MQEYVSTGAVAKALGVSSQYVRDLVAGGRLKQAATLNHGRKTDRLFLVAEVERLRRQREAA